MPTQSAVALGSSTRAPTTKGSTGKTRVMPTVLRKLTARMISSGSRCERRLFIGWSLGNCGRCPSRPLLGQQQVERLAGLVDQGDRLLDLVVRAGPLDLRNRGEHGADRLAHPQPRAGCVGDLLPGHGFAVLGLGPDRRPAGLGQREDAAAAVLLAGHETLLLHRLEGGVHRTWSWCPRSPAAVGELLDHLVAVHRLLGQETQDCRLHVAASRPAAGHLAEAMSPEAEARPAAHPLAPDSALPASSMSSVGKGPVWTLRPMAAAACRFSCHRVAPFMSCITVQHDISLAITMSSASSCSAERLPRIGPSYAGPMNRMRSRSAAGSGAPRRSSRARPPSAPTTAIVATGRP